MSARPAGFALAALDWTMGGSLGWLALSLYTGRVLHWEEGIVLCVAAFAYSVTRVWLYVVLIRPPGLRKEANKVAKARGAKKSMPAKPATTVVGASGAVFQDAEPTRVVMSEAMAQAEDAANR